MMKEESDLLPPREAKARMMARFALSSIVAGALLAVLVGIGALIAVRRGFARLRLGELRLRRSNRGLQRASQRAEQADRLKSAFLATMSHELRTPLNSIIGFTGILLQGLAGPLNPEQDKQLGMVQTSARHLLALINDVLDISKIEAGELRVDCLPFDLRAALIRVADIMRPLAQAKGLALRLELPPELPPVHGDQRRVEQIVLNLLGNAVKFSERGEVVLSAEAQAAFVCLRIRDTGIGIKPDDMHTLFLPFRQIDTGLARHHEGTGLGLAICRRLAALMGGEIRADSTWGKGSTFTFMLPYQGAPNA
ncbi:MAG: hypothetical protein CVV14_02350 [Gammaproteobacteria bacterium HGW-Gammaproteobacteria-4]|nr:MAG: hypothetical protein CVV14_02350 [Gammaproteobacteria bacterium HGW-Gammaproteobacteria-4]